MTHALTSDPLDVLLAHNHWATRVLLEPCRGLTHEQFHRRFEMGPGSLHDTFTHIVGCMRRWSDRIGGCPIRPRIERPAPLPPGQAVPHEGRDRTPDELLSLLDDAAADLAAVAARCREDGLEKTVTIVFEGKTYVFTRGVTLVHVLTHGTYHRAQCRNMMRHLNVPGLSDKLPEVDVIDWQAAVEA